MRGGNKVLNTQNIGYNDFMGLTVAVFQSPNTVFESPVQQNIVNNSSERLLDTS